MVGQVLVHRTQRVGSVEAGLVSDGLEGEVPGEVSAFVAEDLSAVEDVSEVIDEEDAPRLSVL